MRLPVRVFSDIHLGHRASRISNAEALRPLIKGAGTVIFNGDTWEELAEPWRDRSGKMLEDLQRIIAEENCDAVFLRGNHDPGWQGPAYVSLAGGRIIITHGDALLRSSSPWKREILASGNVVEEIWSRYPEGNTDLESRLEIARKIATELSSIHYTKECSLLSRIIDAAFPPKRALSMLFAWLRQGEIGAEFCEAYFPNTEFLVIGHFHFAGVRHVRGKTVINTGSFVVPGPACWVSWDGEFLFKGAVTESNGAFHLAEKSNLWNLFRKT